MTSMAAVPSVSQVLSKANCTVWVLTAYFGAHHLVFLFLFLLLSMQHFGMFIHDPIAFMVIHMPDISSSLFVSWVCLVFLCCTDGFTIVFFGTCVIGLQHISWRLPLLACGPQLHWLYGWSSRDENFLGHGVCLVLLFPFCYSPCLCLVNFSSKYYWPQHYIVRGIIPWNHILSLAYRLNPTPNIPVSKYSCSFSL